MFADKFGYTPEQTRNLPFTDRWALIDGLIAQMKALNDGHQGDSGTDTAGGGFGTAAYSDEDLGALDYDPRFPSASRGDVMASAEELMALGIQYERQ